MTASLAPKNRRRSKAEQRAESLEQIIDAAEYLFSKNGFYGVTLRDVAQRVGIHTTLMHYYFKDKHALFEEVFKRRTGETSGRRMEALERYEAEAGHPTFEEYIDVQRGRYQWVATPPYIELWELALHLELTAAERAAADELKRLAVELTYLANDIGSLPRDPAAKNFVTLLASNRAELHDLNDALAATSQIYREKAESLVAERRRLTSETALGSYAELVCDIADGNLRATTLLARRGSEGRYSPAARDVLEALPLVGSG